MYMIRSQLVVYFTLSDISWVRTSKHPIWFRLPMNRKLSKYTTTTTRIKKRIVFCFTIVSVCPDCLEHLEAEKFIHVYGVYNISIYPIFVFFCNDLFNAIPAYAVPLLCLTLHDYGREKKHAKTRNLAYVRIGLGNKKFCYRHNFAREGFLFPLFTYLYILEVFASFCHCIYNTIETPLNLVLEFLLADMR